MKNTLIIQSGANHTESVTREITQSFLEKAQRRAHSGPNTNAINVRHLDLESLELPLFDQALLNAFSVEEQNRSEHQQQLMSLSDQFVRDLQWADELVIGVPLYNFSVPARLKAWIDLVCRAGLTFEYTESGPRGLLNISKAYFVLATGGTPIGGEMDFASGYLQHIASFLGIENSEVIRADGSKRKRDEIINHANDQIDQLLAA